MEWIYGMVVAWKNVKPPMNSVYIKNDLGHYSWRNSEFINDVWTWCVYVKYAHNLVACYCKGVV